MNAFSAAGATDPGCIRKNNEDRILTEMDHGVFVLADGMGGEKCGELAADIAVQVTGEYFLQTENSNSVIWPYGFDPTLTSPQNRVMNAVRLANRRIWEKCQSLRDCEGMGTTISALLLSGATATIGNIGDSRVYLLRDGRFRLLTSDDAVVAEMVESGEIAAEEARTHPLRNVLTMALGRDEDIAVQLVEFLLKVGDRLMLSSDGLHAVVDDSTIKDILERGNDAQITAMELIQAAKEQGGPDNISSILVDCLQLPEADGVKQPQ